jgi:hypothetical protein
LTEAGAETEGEKLFIYETLNPKPQTPLQISEEVL